MQYQAISDQKLVAEKQATIEAHNTQLDKLNDEIEELKESKKNLYERMKKNKAESGATILGLEDKANNTR